jgi:hypothetical protein
MPNLKKTKKNETCKDFFKDKYVAIFLAIILVVAINHLVFSYLLLDRDKVSAFSTGFATATMFNTLGDQSVAVGSTNVVLAEFILPDAFGNDALVCDYALAGNPCVTFIDGDGTATTTPGTQDDPVAYLTDMEVNDMISNIVFTYADNICTDSLDPTVAPPTCVYIDTTDGTACTDGLTVDAYILGSGCAGGGDVQVAGSTLVGVATWIHYENPLGTSGAYDSGEDIFVIKVKVDEPLATGTLWANAAPGQWQGDTPGSWLGLGVPGGEGFVDVDPTNDPATGDGIYSGSAGVRDETVIIDLDGDQLYTNGPDTLVDADGSDTGVGSLGTDDDAIPAGAGLTALSVADGVCINTIYTPAMIIYKDGNGDCIPGNGGTDNIIRDVTSTGLPGIITGFGTYPYTFITANNLVLYYDNNPANGAYDFGANAAATESLWLEMQDITQWNANVEGSRPAFEADGTGSLAGLGVPPNIDDDPVARWSSLQILATTDFVCISAFVTGNGLEDVYVDGSGIPGECIPGNGGVDTILMDVSTNGLIAAGTFDGTWASAAGTLSYFEHIGGAGYDFGANAATTESLWLGLWSSSTYTATADTSFPGHFFPYYYPGDTLTDLSTATGPDGQPIIYADADVSGTLNDTDTVLEDNGNLQTGPAGVPNGVIDRQEEMFDRIVFQNAGTAGPGDLVNVRLFGDIWWWGGDGRCDASDGLFGDFTNDGTLTNGVTDFTDVLIPLFVKVCLIADIPLSAGGGSTFRMKIPALSDAGTLGRYDTGDLGWFNYSSNDGPIGGDVLAPDTFTITGVSSEGGIQVTEDMLASGDLPTLGGEETPVAPGQPSLPGDLQVGDLIKSASSNSVYVVTSEGKRNIFPHESVFYSYFTGFDNILAVSDNIISQLPIGRNVTIRPGTNLIKLQTNPSVYAVEPGGVIRMLKDEAMAVSFYGDNWAQKVVDILDAFWPDYIEGEPIETAMYPTGTILRYLSSGDVWYIDEGIARLVSSEVFDANNFKQKYIVNNVVKNDFDYDIGEDLKVMDMFEVKLMVTTILNKFFR